MLESFILFLLWAAGSLVLLLLVVAGILIFMSRVVVGDDEVGIVFKKTTQQLPTDPAARQRLIALGGEAGWQADTLAPGTYLGTWVWSYEVRKVPVIKIPPGEIGLVIADDGAPLLPEQQLGRLVECNSFQDAHMFLSNGGQKGRQLGILTTGTYRINTEIFTIVTAQNAADYGLKPEDLHVHIVEVGTVGIVTTLEGAQIPAGDIAGPVVQGHNCFQNAQLFLDAGGCKGLQEEVLQAGAYHLNPWFVRVESRPLTHITPGTVGVVISHVGKTLDNHTGDHPVEPGYKGVWRTPLLPGQHPLNPKVVDVEIVPTYAITLDWSNKAKPDYHYDAPLHAVSLRSNDGHIFDIEVTQVISIRGEDAPRMILRVGSIAAREIDQQSNAPASTPRYRSIRNLVTRVLEPMIGNHFRNSAQDYSVLDFLTNRRERQIEAMEHIKEALKEYGVQAAGTFINEIDLPDDLEKSLQERKLAEVQRETLVALQLTEDERLCLVEKQAQTERQKQLVAAQTQTDIASYQAEALRMKAEAETRSLREREMIDVDVLRNIVEILGPEGYLRREHVEQLTRVKLPETIVGNTGIFEALLTQIIGTIAHAVSTQLPPNPTSTQPIAPTDGMKPDITPLIPTVLQEPDDNIARAVGGE